MNKSSEHAKEQRVWRMLKAAYSQKDEEPFEFGNRWQQDLMRDIRRIGPLTAKMNPLGIADRLVWRFATAACAFALILAVYVGFTGWNPLEELNAQYFKNPVEFTVAQAFGVYDSYE